jgi:hypothetical protein
MMVQGTDRLSHGAPSYGIDTGVGVPLHLSPLQRDLGLLAWLQAWIPSPRVLDPYGWFTLGHGIAAFEPNSDGIPTPITVKDHSVFLWHPAPAAAEAALEELCLARHKRPHLHHVFICPRLFTHTWHKRLFKFVDLTFNLSPGFILGVWPTSQHEPLVIGILLPHLPHYPWLWRHSASMGQFRQQLHRVFAARTLDLTALLSTVWNLLL